MKKMRKPAKEDSLKDEKNKMKGGKNKRTVVKKYEGAIRAEEALYKLIKLHMERKDSRSWEG